MNNEYVNPLLEGARAELVVSIKLKEQQIRKRLDDQYYESARILLDDIASLNELMNCHKMFSELFKFDSAPEQKAPEEPNKEPSDNKEDE
tara:strand:- start:6345 stop:6614 length:270 start_codon:yes stop_codon:yes gene_type:complete